MTKREAVVKSIIYYIDSVKETQTLKNNTELIPTLKYLRDEIKRLSNDFGEKSHIDNTDAEAINDFIKIIENVQSGFAEENNDLNLLKIYLHCIRELVTK